MDAPNPYEAPKTSLQDQTLGDAPGDLAGRGARLGASIIDGIITMFTSVPLMISLGVIEDIQQGRESAPEILATLMFVNLAIFLAIHGWTLVRRGQTLGKIAMDVRIADMDGKVPAMRLLLLRLLPLWLASAIPVVGVLLPYVDALFIFRKDRRCLHDLLAGTQVLMAVPNSAQASTG